MTHFRTAIRAGAVALLKEATAAEERVFDSLLSNLNPAQLPAVKVYTTDDQGGVRELGGSAGSGGAQNRSVTLIIECVIANHDDDEDDSDFAARIDDLSGEVEAAIEADPTLGGVCADAAFEGASIAPSVEGDVPTYLATLTYRVAAMNKGDQLAGGRLGVVTVDGVAIGRLRAWSIDTNAEPADVTSAAHEWAQVSNKVVGRWSAELAMTLDDDDEGQALLGLKFIRDFVFCPQGQGAGKPAYGGGAAISAVNESVSDTGEIIRTVTITGNGSLT